MCVTAPGIVCHKIRDDKGADTFSDLVGKYCGVIVCDALKTHEAGARGNELIQLAGRIILSRKLSGGFA